jgi:hypothetical protein
MRGFLVLIFTSEMPYEGIKGRAWESIKRRTRAKERDCYTCPAKDLEGQNAQAGHFTPVALAGSNNTLSWDERQIHLQCGRCNGAGQGQQVAFRIHLVRDYGEKIVQEFEARRWKVDPVKDWQESIDRA